MFDVSIVITTYKGMDSIYSCVNSAINQDFINFEVIVVDDNGRGTNAQLKTQFILSSFISSKKIKYIVHDINKNGSAARNTGIKASNGKYIAFVDDDDILYENSIRLRYKCLSSKDKDYGIVFTSFEQYIFNNKDIDVIYNFDGNIQYDYLLNKYHSPSSVLMIKKEVFDHVGLWDESFRRHQDWEIITRILNQYKACSISDITVKRIVCNRNNAKKPHDFEKNRIHYLNKMTNIIEKYPKKMQRKIYFIHYVDIGKNYLKNKNIINSLKWAFKSKNPIYAFWIYFTSFIKFYKRRNLR